MIALTLLRFSLFLIAFGAPFSKLVSIYVLHQLTDVQLQFHDCDPKNDIQHKNKENLLNFFAAESYFGRFS